MKPWEYRRKPVSPSERVVAKDFWTNESKSHNFPEQFRFETKGVLSSDTLELVQDSCIKQDQAKMPNEAQREDAPSLNKGTPTESGDNGHYHRVSKTNSGGESESTANLQTTSVGKSYSSPEAVRQAYDLADGQRDVDEQKGVHISDKQSLSDVREPAQNVYEAYGSPRSISPSFLGQLMAWRAAYRELRVEHPNGIILNAQPRHIHDAMERHSWSVVYTPERFLLTSWGDVPRYALTDKRDLETGELLIAEQVAA